MSLKDGLLTIDGRLVIGIPNSQQAIVNQAIELGIMGLSANQRGITSQGMGKDALSNFYVSGGSPEDYGYFLGVVRFFQRVFEKEV